MSVVWDTTLTGDRKSSPLATTSTLRWQLLNTATAIRKRGRSCTRGRSAPRFYRLPDDDHALNIIVKGITCLDSKIGKSYETTITVVMDGVGYKGCEDVLNR